MEAGSDMKVSQENRKIYLSQNDQRFLPFSHTDAKKYKISNFHINCLNSNLLTTERNHRLTNRGDPGLTARLDALDFGV